MSQTDTMTKVNSYLSFTIGNEVFAANVKNVLNILEMCKITKIPKAPEYMKGVINLRGTVLPIVDSRVKFSMEETDYTTNTCIVVLELHNQEETITLGAIVDSVREVLELSDNDIMPPPSIGTTYKSDYLKGMARPEEDFIMILDTEKVFGNEEITDMNNIAKSIKKEMISPDE